MRKGAAAGLADLLDGGVHGIAEIDTETLSAVMTCQLAGRAPDAAARPGNDDAFAFQHVLSEWLRG